MTSEMENKMEKEMDKEMSIADQLRAYMASPMASPMKISDGDNNSVLVSWPEDTFPADNQYSRDSQELRKLCAARDKEMKQLHRWKDSCKKCSAKLERAEDAMERIYAAAGKRTTINSAFVKEVIEGARLRRTGEKE